MLFGNINYSSAGKAVLFFFWALASVLPSSTWTSQQSTRALKRNHTKCFLKCENPKLHPPTPPKRKKKKAENQKEPSTMLKCNKTKCNLVRMCILTESRALLKSREALPFSGLSGNTWDWTNSIKSFIQLEYQKFIWKELSSYDASSGFHSFLELSDNSQCKLNVGIYELIWRPLHINRISRKACTCSISFLCKNHLLN